MKKIALIAALAAAIALTGCTRSAAEPAPTITVTASQTAPAPAPDNDAPQAGGNQSSMSDDELYLMLLRNEDPTFNSIDDRTLTDLGQTTCDAFDAGMTLEMYAAVATSSGITTQEAATIAAAAIVVYCPWHEGIAG